MYPNSTSNIIEGDEVEDLDSVGLGSLFTHTVFLYMCFSQSNFIWPLKLFLLIFRESGLDFSINYCEKRLEYPGHTYSGVGHKLAITQCREPGDPPKWSNFWCKSVRVHGWSWNITERERECWQVTLSSRTQTEKGHRPGSGDPNPHQWGRNNRSREKRLCGRTDWESGCRCKLGHGIGHVRDW